MRVHRRGGGGRGRGDPSCVHGSGARPSGMSGSLHVLGANLDEVSPMDTDERQHFRYEDSASRGVAPDGSPREPPAKTVTEVVDRLSAFCISGTSERLAPDYEIKEMSKKFEAAQVVQRWEDHMSQRHLKKQVEAPDGETHLTLALRPAFSDTKFYANLLPDGTIGEPGNLRVYGVSKAAHCSRMLMLNYTQVEIAFPASWQDLPAVLPLESSGAEADSPTDKQVGCFAPSITRGSPSAQVVMWWEEKTEKEGTAYAPLYRWTDEERKKLEFWRDLSGQSSRNIWDMLRRAGQVYCYLLDLNPSNPAAAVAENDDKYGALKLAAAAHFKPPEEAASAASSSSASQALGEKRARSTSSRARGDKEHNVNWFEMAQLKARERVEGSLPG